MGTGIGHLIPIVAYLGFWLMCVLSLTGRPLYGLYYLLPFLPYRTMRDHFDDYPLGSNVLTLLILCIIVGAVIKQKRLPASKLYLTWLGFGVYLYLSLWIGTAISNAPAPLWLSDVNFVTWKDYMLIPLLFVAASLVIEDRKAIRTVVLITAVSLFLVDKSALAESLSHSWSNFDENKRTPGPIEFGVNELGAFLAQFAMFFWGFARLMKRFKVKVICYGLVALTAVTAMYTFSRGAYAAILLSVLVLALVKDLKLLAVLVVFMATWQSVVPTAVTQRVTMTESSDGKLEASAQERVDLWTQSKEMFLSSPVFGRGYATFQMGDHTDNLKDTHNWYVKVLTETGVIGGIFAVLILAQLVRAGWSLYRRAVDPLYKALGLGFLLAMVSCIVSNLFGDRWTYVEIMGLLWVLAAATLRASQLIADGAEKLPMEDEAIAWKEQTASLAPHMEWS